MSWSTRELADLAGTTVNTVRHYHRRGLLDEPERGLNGYKRYGAEHLVRLLQIRRLRDVGVPIARMEQHPTGVATTAQVLREIDAQLVGAIERSRQARAAIEAMLQSDATGQVPLGFEPVAARLSPRERSLTLIYSQLYDDTAMADVKEMLTTEVDPANEEFEALPANADAGTRDRLARELAGSLAKVVLEFPWLREPRDRLLKDERTTADTWLTAVVALYNEAQLDVMKRASTLAQELTSAEV